MMLLPFAFFFHALLAFAGASVLLCVVPHYDHLDIVLNSKYSAHFKGYRLKEAPRER